jgi:hypothetical protein
MKKILIVINILLFGFSLSTCKRQAGDDYSKIIFFIGDVKKNNVPVEIGDIILQNDIILTGKLSSCDIKFGGSFLRVKEDTKIVLSELSNKNNLENTSIGLDVGKILCKAKKLTRSESLTVKTPTAVASVRGTQFTVEADAQKTSQIKVFTGEVKVVKRVSRLEDSVDQLLETAPAVEDNEKVIITLDEIVKIEKKVDAAFSKENQKNNNMKTVLDAVLNDVRNDIEINKKEVRSFKLDDFSDENKEIIAVVEKPKSLIDEIQKAVEIEKKEPVPEGRLIVTRYEIHFIKDGRPVWEGKVINPPVKKDDKIYIASGSYVFCASVDGPVYWKREIKNNGKVEIKDNKLIVFSGNETKELDLVTGL